MMYTLSQFVPLLDIYCRTMVRGKIREQKGIDGSCFNDLLCHLCCAFCAIAQEAQVRSIFVLSINKCLHYIFLFLYNCRNFLQRASQWQENSCLAAAISNNNNNIANRHFIIVLSLFAFFSVIFVRLSQLKLIFHIP